MIVCYEPIGDGAHVTILDASGDPRIVSLDFDDLDRFTSIAEAARNVDMSKSQEDRVRITPRGVEWLRESLQGGGA